MNARRKVVLREAHTAGVARFYLDMLVEEAIVDAHGHGYERSR